MGEKNVVIPNFMSESLNFLEKIDAPGRFCAVWASPSWVVPGLFEMIFTMLNLNVCNDVWELQKAIFPIEERKVSNGDSFLDTLEQLEILDATGPPGWDENWALEFGYTKPGQTPTLSKCYSSKATNVEVFVRIETGDVSTVNLLNRQDWERKFKFLINFFWC